jgi:hypothetical protein
MVRDFQNLALTGSAETRARANEIVRIILALMGITGGPGNPPEIGSAAGDEIQVADLEAIGLVKSVQLTWFAPPGAATYTIYRSLDQSTYTIVGSTSLTDFLDTGLADETQYFYYVQASALNGAVSLPSEVAFATTLEDTTVAAPDIPANFVVTSSTYANVLLGWDALTGTSVGISIERRTATAPWVEIVAQPGGVAFDDLTVEEGTTYDYRARSFNSEAVYSAYTAVVSETTATLDVTPPSVPGYLSLTPAIGSITAVAVPSPELDTRGYIFGIGTAPGGPYTDQPETMTPEILFPGLADETAYYVVIRSVDESNNESADSAEATTTTLPPAVGDVEPPPRVPALQSATLAPGEATVYFQQVAAPDLAGYDIEQSTSNPYDGYAVVQTIPAGTGVAQFAGLSETDTHWFRVVSFDTTGNRALPSPQSAVVPDGSDNGAIIGFTANNQGLFPDAVGVPVPPEVGTNSPTLGITADGSLGSTVHEYYTNTAEQNKDLFVDGMRSVRAPRSGIVYPVAGPNSTIQNFVDTTFEGRWNVACNTGQGDWDVNTNGPRVYRPSLNAFVLDNVSFLRWYWEGQYETLWGAENQVIEGHTSKWAVQLYDMPAAITRNCDFGCPETGTGPIEWPRVHQEFTQEEAKARYPGQTEHDVYHHTLRTCIFQNVTSRFIGGHGFYIAGRPYAFQIYRPDCTLPTVAPLALVDNSHFVDSSVFFGKASSCIEIFDYGTPANPGVVFIRNTTVVDAYDFWVAPEGGNALHRDLINEHETGWYRSAGALNISGYQFVEYPQIATANSLGDIVEGWNAPGGQGAGVAPTKLCLVKNSLFHQQDPGKAMCGFGSVTDVRFEDCTLISEGNGITGWSINRQAYRSDDPGTPTVNVVRGTPRTETITFANCRTKNVRLTFQRMEPGVQASSSITVTVPADLRNRSVTYTISPTVTGAAGITVNGGTIYDPTGVAYDPVADAYPIAAEINTLDPFAAVNGVPGDFDWQIPGVTV